MTQLPWHDYSGESADELFALVGSHRTDSLVVAFETALGQKVASLGANALSEPERDVLAVEALEREVNNGGYAQFFRNSSNAYAGIVVDALGRSGCSATASVTERAIAALGPGASLTAESLSAMMDQDDEKRDVALNECDHAYYATGEDIATGLLEYLLRVRDRVRLVG